MPLNLDMVGQMSPPYGATHTPDQVILYALSIGAGVNELDFVYEKELKVFPTFATIPFFPVFLEKFAPQANLNLMGVIHGEQAIRLHRPIPPAATLYSRLRWDGVYDKGSKGAFLHLTLETRDESESLIYENRALVIDRTAGNFGGERGPSVEPIRPPVDQTPDFQVTYPTSPNQAALYRLCGDKNPLHIDTGFAQACGFKVPILHGLCTYGFTGRAILHALCGGDPERFRSFRARFKRAVFPGDTLTIQGWKAAPGRYIVQTVNQEGKVVLGNAETEVQAD
jgi:acyl dehydratase